MKWNGRKGFPCRGEIYWVNLEPVIGSETKKKRPGLVISNDVGNEFSNLVIIAPITSKVVKIYPFEVETFLLSKRGKIMLNQCRAVDKSRLLSYIDEIDLETMKSVEEAIRVVFSL